MEAGHPLYYSRDTNFPQPSGYHGDTAGLSNAPSEDAYALVREDVPESVSDIYASSEFIPLLAVIIALVKLNASLATIRRTISIRGRDGEPVISFWLTFLNRGNSIFSMPGDIDIPARVYAISTVGEDRPITYISEAELFHVIMELLESNPDYYITFDMIRDEQYPPDINLKLVQFFRDLRSIKNYHDQNDEYEHEFLSKPFFRAAIEDIFRRVRNAEDPITPTMDNTVWQWVGSQRE